MASRIFRGVAVAALASICGCAYIPYLKKFVKKAYLPYLGSKMYSFEYPRKWGEPLKIDHGVQVRNPDALGRFSIEFIPKEDKAYVPPDKYRRDMSAWGSVEDRHIVSRVEFSSRPAYNVQFTTYEYDARYLVGEKVRVETVDLTMIPDPRGIFLITLRTPRDELWNKKIRREYRHWLASLVLSAPPDKP